jgi:hypothetical protein
MSSLWVLNIGTRRASGTSVTGLGSMGGRRNSKTDSTGTSTWHRQQLLGQPPTRRAYHSAHRVLVGGKERIVIYGGEIGEGSSGMGGTYVGIQFSSSLDGTITDRTI